MNLERRNYIEILTNFFFLRATLLDLEGTLLAQMEGAVLMETTVGTIMSALEAQKLSLPNMYEDVWRTQGMGPMERR